MHSSTSIRKHIQARIESATLELSPFPHLIIENFFPDEVYAQLLERNPFQRNAGVKWMEEDLSKNVSARTPYHARKQINFHENQKFNAPEQDLEFWQSIQDTFLNDQWFEKLVVSKFPQYFSIRFGDSAQDDAFLAGFRKELFLQRHEVGYNIGPHTDIPTRVFTCIFSFAASEGFEEFGTELLKPKKADVRCWGNDHYSMDDFVVEKIAPYKPNNFLLFFKTRHSFHSVRAITPQVPAERYGMQFQFYEPAGGIFTDLSAPDIMRTSHKEGRMATAKKLVKTLIGA